MSVPNTNGVLPSPQTNGINGGNGVGVSQGSREETSILNRIRFRLRNLTSQGSEARKVEEVKSPEIEKIRQHLEELTQQKGELEKYIQKNLSKWAEGAQGKVSRLESEVAKAREEVESADKICRTAKNEYDLLMARKKMKEMAFKEDNDSPLKKVKAFFRERESYETRRSKSEEVLVAFLPFEEALKKKYTEAESQLKEAQARLSRYSSDLYYAEIDMQQHIKDLERSKYDLARIDADYKIDELLLQKEQVKSKIAKDPKNKELQAELEKIESRMLDARKTRYDAWKTVAIATLS